MCGGSAVKENGRKKGIKGKKQKDIKKEKKGKGGKRGMPRWSEQFAYEI